MSINGLAECVILPCVTKVKVLIIYFHCKMRKNVLREFIFDACQIFYQIITIRKGKYENVNAFAKKKITLNERKVT